MQNRYRYALRLSTLAIAPTVAALCCPRYVDGEDVLLRTPQTSFTSKPWPRSLRSRESAPYFSFDRHPLSKSRNIGIFGSDWIAYRTGGDQSSDEDQTRRADFQLPPAVPSIMIFEPKYSVLILCTLISLARYVRWYVAFLY